MVFGLASWFRLRFYFGGFVFQNHFIIFIQFEQDGFAIFEFMRQHGIRQLVFNQLLNELAARVWRPYPGHNPGLPEGLLLQELASTVIPCSCKPFCHFGNFQMHNLTNILAVECPEDDHTIQPVNKLGAEDTLE